MTDPLAEFIELLSPRAIFSKEISGAGRWGVRYAAFGQPGFCAVIEGRCRLAVDGELPVSLEQGDFVLLPATPAFAMTGFDPVVPKLIDPRGSPSPLGDVRHGRQDGPADVRLLGGHFVIDSPDSALIVSLLPTMIHIRGNDRLSALVRLVGEEAGMQSIGRNLVLTRLIDILMIEALRATPGKNASPGLLRGLADARIAAALRQLHSDVERTWTVSELASQAGMSRSAFFERFARTVGMRPMAYLHAWRMAVAKRLLRDEIFGLDEVARRVGYGSASTFSTAFSRHTGLPPGRYARADRVEARA